MNPVEIITAKRDSKQLSSKQIKFFIDKYTTGDIPDYQMSAFLMAVYFNMMTAVETAALTQAMLDSGDKIVFDLEDKKYVDKHSSGGVGDKVSIILAPLMASCGLKVPMMSGRGLGHTGGTLDKLESIPGFKTDLSIDEFKEIVEKTGCAITGQTPQIAPADKKMYALRDVTGTVESIPLICGSILSKKFAAGPNSIIFDIKCGNGAFMKNIDQAKKLGDSLSDICRVMNKGVDYLITDMNQPLGKAAGNALEIDESIASLKGEGPDDLMQVVYSLGESMLRLGGIASGEKAITLQTDKIADGSVFEKFLQMVKAQGGDTDCLQKDKPLNPAKNIIPIKAEQPGFIKSIDTYKLGRLIIEMGGGRTTVGQAIDHSVGFIIHKKIADKTEENDLLLEVHSNRKISDDSLRRSFGDCFEIVESEIKPPDLIKQG